MPVYADSKAVFLQTNGQYLVWSAESVAANGKSAAVQLERRKSQTNYPAWGFAVQISSTTSIGTFEVEVQGAETDNDASYVKLASITTANASNVGRGDFMTYYPKYVRLFMKTLTGTQTITGIITH
jgi:hypothetical protein